MNGDILSAKVMALQRSLSQKNLGTVISRRTLYPEDVAGSSYEYFLIVLGNADVLLSHLWL